jgi:hypothetical protein
MRVHRTSIFVHLLIGPLSIKSKKPIKRIRFIGFLNLKYFYNLRFQSLHNNVFDFL